ncbi:MAG: D-serine ammonia-lyase [Bacillota bacterium]
MLDQIRSCTPVIWTNPQRRSVTDVLPGFKLTARDMKDAEARWQRFAPLLKRLFPETENGMIESPLVEINRMRTELERMIGRPIPGRYYLKCDNQLPVAGSIKARGGIYEVLKHAEELALTSGMLTLNDDYACLADGQFHSFFAQHKIAVGSTGNLGLSIGITSAALGFQVTVHMSRDAKQWKKDLLRSKGATVVEHSDDYSKAVEEGRRQCEGDPMAYFVDDENSSDLFLGYSVAAVRLAGQLREQGVVVDAEHPLYLYLPCGVGGAPGGITFGAKQIFGDHVHCYFVEPTHSPCMLLGLATQRFSSLHVRDYGLDNLTEADGLAVGSPSRLVSEMADQLIDGVYTIRDDDLFRLLTALYETEGIKVEPSAAAGLLGPTVVDASVNATHVAWATGGLFVPDEIFRSMVARGLGL